MILNTYKVSLIPPYNYLFSVALINEFFKLADLIGLVEISAIIGLS